MQDEQTTINIGGKVVTPKQLAEALEGHFRVLCAGLAVTNPAVPPDIMWAAIAEAMGGVLSGVSQQPQDLTMAIKLRAHFADIVMKAIKTRHPATAGSASTIIRAAGMN